MYFAHREKCQSDRTFQKMLWVEERYSGNCVSFLDPQRLKGRCDSSHINQRSWMFKWNSIPFLCLSETILLFVLMDKFAPQILSTLMFSKTNVNAGALFETWMRNVSQIHKFWTCTEQAWVWGLECLQIQSFWHECSSVLELSDDVTPKEGFTFGTPSFHYFSSFDIR